MEAAKPFWQDPGFWVNVVLALFAAASAGAAFWQGWLVKKAREDAGRNSEVQEKHNQQLAEAASRSADAAEQSAAATKALAETGQRAWLTYESAVIKARTPQQLPLFVVSELRNGGSTPAVNVDMYQEWKIFKEFPRALDFRDGQTGSRGAVGPQCVAQIPTDITLSLMDDAVVRKRESRLFLYGYATYDDVFGGKHKTEWCLHFLVESQSFTFAPKFNESD